MKMDKYLDADKLEKDGWSMQRIRQASPTEMIYETKKPTDFPAADVVKVRHGKWIYRGDRGRFPACECSVCGNVENADWTILGDNVNYCPNCRAKMMNEDEEMSKVSEMEMAYGEYLND